MSGLCADEIELLTVIGNSDEVLPKIAAAMSQQPLSTNGTADQLDARPAKLLGDAEASNSKLQPGE